MTIAAASPLVASPPRLLAITDLTAAPRERWLARLDALAACLAPSSMAVVLRDHQLPAKLRLDFGRELRALTRARHQELWVADRLDLALLLEADGLHLGEDSVRPSAVLPFWKRRVSRAWHAPGVVSALEQELEGVGALLVSPVLAARKGREALGLDGLSRLAEQLAPRRSIALYALGGVTAATTSACLGAGAWGVAAIGAALSDEPGALAAALALPG